MLNRRLLVAFLWILVSCSGPKYKNPHVEIQTRLGKIKVELYVEKAPKSVAAFLSNIKAGFYRDAAFYRVLTVYNQPSDYYKAELIQGGIWRKKRKLSDSLPGIPHEPTNITGISHQDGVISFARLEPGTAKTEFFICLGDQPGFDFGGKNNPDGQGYAAFCRVVEGMEIVSKIYNQPEYEQRFDPPVDIFNIVRL